MIKSVANYSEGLKHNILGVFSPPPGPYPSNCAQIILRTPALTFSNSNSRILHTFPACFSFLDTPPDLRSNLNWLCDMTRAIVSRTLRTCGLFLFAPADRRAGTARPEWTVNDERQLGRPRAPPNASDETLRR